MIAWRWMGVCKIVLNDALMGWDQRNETGRRGGSVFDSYHGRSRWVTSIIRTFIWKKSPQCQGLREHNIMDKIKNPLTAMSSLSSEEYFPWPFAWRRPSESPRYTINRPIYRSAKKFITYGIVYSRWKASTGRGMLKNRTIQIFGSWLQD